MDNRTVQVLVSRLVQDFDTPAAADHWRIAADPLVHEFSAFDRGAWLLARRRHGNRAALAVIETALITRIRDGTTAPIRSPVAYLGGILRRQRGECRPEITLERLAARDRGRLDIHAAHTD